MAHLRQIAEAPATEHPPLSELLDHFWQSGGFLRWGIIAYPLLMAWWEGGRHASAPMVFGTWAWSLVVLHCVWVLTKRAHRSSTWRRRWPPLVLALPWVALILMAGWSVGQPSHQWVVSDTGAWVLRKLADAPVGPQVFDVTRSGPMIWHWTGTLAVVLLATCHFRQRPEIRLAWYAWWINGTIICLSGLIAKASDLSGFLTLDGIRYEYFFATFRYHNHWVAWGLLYLGICLSLGYYWWWRELQSAQVKGKWFIFLGTLMLGIFGLMVSESRTGLLMLLGLGLANMAWWVYRSSRHGMADARSMVLRVMGIGGLMLGLAALGYPIYGERFEEWMGRWTDIQQWQDVDRFRFDAYPKITWALFLEKPWFGWGWGSYQWAYWTQASGIMRFNWPEFAHNDWLQYLAELGLVGVGLYLGGWTAWLTPRVRAHWYRPVVFPTLSVVGLLALMALWEFPWSNPAVIAQGLLLLALMGKYAESYNEISRQPNHERSRPHRST